MVLGPRITASSLVVLVFRAEDHHVRNFASRLMDYFNRRRSELVFDAMGAQPLFIYIALYQCFNSFTTFFYQYQRIYREVVSAFQIPGMTAKRRGTKHSNKQQRLDRLLNKRRELPVSSRGVFV